MTIQPNKTSTTIHYIATSSGGLGMTVGRFVELLGDRAFWLAIFLFLLITLFAGVAPGISTLMAMPILLLSLQLLVGRETVWLPKKIANKHISQKALDILVSKALPYVIRLEKILKPRWLYLSSPLGERVAALVIIGVAIILIVPIPGVHFLPCLGSVILSLGMLERDGILIATALILTIGSVDAMYKLIEAAVHTLAHALHSVAA